MLNLKICDILSLKKDDLKIFWNSLHISAPEGCNSVKTYCIHALLGSFAKLNYNTQRHLLKTRQTESRSTFAVDEYLLLKFNTNTLKSEMHSVFMCSVHSVMFWPSGTLQTATSAPPLCRATSSEYSALHCSNSSQAQKHPNATQIISFLSPLCYWA